MCEYASLFDIAYPKVWSKLYMNHIYRDLTVFRTTPFVSTWRALPDKAWELFWSTALLLTWKETPTTMSARACLVVKLLCALIRYHILYERILGRLLSYQKFLFAPDSITIRSSLRKISSLVMCACMVQLVGRHISVVLLLNVSASVTLELWLFVKVVETTDVSIWYGQHHLFSSLCSSQFFSSSM